MNTFIGLYLITTIACLLSNNGKKKLARQIACSVIFVCLQLLIGLRHINYGGVDTQVYARDFVRIVNQNISFIGIFSNFYKDYGFYLLAKLFSLLCKNYNAWLFFCAIPYTYGVTWLIYKYSKDIYLSFVMYLSLGFYLYNFQLVRHTFALGLIIIAYKSLEEGNTKKFFLITLFASFCHSISAIFFLAYFLRSGRVTFRQVIWIVVGCILIYILAQPNVWRLLFKAIPFLNSTRFYHYLDDTSSGISSEFYIQILIIIVCWYYLYKKKNITNNIYNAASIKQVKKTKLKISYGYYNVTNPNLTLLFNMSVIAALFYYLTIVLAEGYRIAQYFSIFTVILLPNAISNESKKYIRLILKAFVVFFCIKHFFGALSVDVNGIYTPFVYFWERTQFLY